ncbi:hypothetical protein D6C95_10100 [Aureobasidium pullulans]|nr:hypothetical protein D6C95_10100 [Aureobasidium pullulans]
MRSSAIIFAGLAAVAHAQIDASIISQIPACATGPLIAGISGSGCQVTDVACICGNQKLIADLQTAVKADCNEADLAKALEVTGKICPSAASGAAADAASSASSAATSAASEAASISSVAAAATTGIITDSGCPITTASMGTGTGTASINYTATTGEYTPPATPTVTPSTGGAAQSFALGGMVMGIGALVREHKDPSRENRQTLSSSTRKCVFESGEFLPLLTRSRYANEVPNAVVDIVCSRRTLGDS